MSNEANSKTIEHSDTNERYSFQIPHCVGSVVYGPKWDKPTAVGASDGGTFIAQPVYRHDIAALLAKIADLENRVAKLEATNNA